MKRSKLKPIGKSNHKEVDITTWGLNTTDNMEKKLRKPFQQALAKALRQVEGDFEPLWEPFSIIVKEAVTEALQLAVKNSKDQNLVWLCAGPNPLMARVCFELGPMEGMGPGWEFDMREVILETAQDYPLDLCERLHKALAALTDEVGKMVEMCREEG